MASALFPRRKPAGPGVPEGTAGVRSCGVRPAAKAANTNKTNTICLSLGPFSAAPARFLELRLLFRAATRFFRPFEKEIDPAFHVRVFVLLKMQLRYVVQAQPGG